MSDSRSDLAAARFPDEWRKWSALTGKAASKRRQQLRKAAEEAVIMDGLQASGASCATCVGFVREGPCGSYCSADSDFHGYMLAQASGLCVRWKVANA